MILELAIQGLCHDFISNNDNNFHAKQKGNNDLRKLLEQITLVLGPKFMNSFIFLVERRP